MLAGAFASGKGLKESKEEKKERLEVAELSRLLEPPKWVTPSLLAELRTAASGESSTSSMVNIVEDAVMRASTVAKIETDAGEPLWAVLAPPGGEAHESYTVVCLSQAEDHKLVGAAAFFSAAHKGGGGFKAALRAADATRIVLIDGDASDAMPLGHPTVVGLGENDSTPYPASSDMTAPACVHLAEAMRLFLDGKALINARLQRGGASTDERAFVQKRLLGEAGRRLHAVCACGDAEARDYSILNRVESAVGGLRKMYLKRSDWDQRCLECGTRHTEVEKGTCKFWKRWAEDAKANEENEAATATATATEAAASDAASPAAAKQMVAPDAAAPLATAEQAEAAKPNAEVAPKPEAAEPEAVAKPEAVAEPEAASEQLSFTPFMPHLRRKEMAERSPNKENAPEALQLS